MTTLYTQVTNGITGAITDMSIAKKILLGVTGGVASVVLFKYAVERSKSDSDPDVHSYYKQLVAEDKQMDREVETVHGDLDVYTKMVLVFTRKANLEHNAKAPKAYDIPEPKIRKARVEKAPMYGDAIALATTDEDFDEPLSKRMLRKFVNVVQRNDFEDTNEAWPSVAAAITFRETYLGDVMPAVNVRYEELCSDDAMSRMAFSGLCCGYTRGIAEDADADVPIPKGAAFVADCSFLNQFRVKPGYEQYGAIAYFDAKCSIVGIFWCHANRMVMPRDKDWEHAKYVWRSTFLAIVTIKDHLFETHMVESNGLNVATIEELPPTHPLRHFLKPFTYRTTTINQRATKSLMNEKGLVHRIWAFDYAQVLEIFAFASKHYTFRTIPERVHPSMKKIDDSVFGFHADAMAFWRVMRKYVAGFLAIHFQDAEAILRDRAINAFALRLSVLLEVPPFECNGDDAERFIDVLTQLLCSVTGIHEHVGQVSDYIMSPDWMGTRLRANSNMCSVQEYAQIIALVCATGMKAPKLMGDWSHLIPKDEHYERVLALYNEWGADLITASDEVQRRNKTRKYPIEAFDPRKMECSVSV